MNNIWTYVGIALLAWIGYDLYAGYTLLWDVIYRDQDPASYWTVLGIWFVLAVSCFFPWGNDEQ